MGTLAVTFPSLSQRKFASIAVCDVHLGVYSREPDSGHEQGSLAGPRNR